MLKKETLKQAIDAIASRDAEIGYSLSELFGTGRIAMGASAEQTASDGHYCFFVDGRRVSIKKMNYFREGTAAIEQSLVVQYGELAHKQALAQFSGSMDYAGAEQAIRLAGLQRLLRYEIQRASDLLEDQEGDRRGPARDETRRLLIALRDAPPMERLQRISGELSVIFVGAVNADTPAYFVPFPYGITALMQVLDLGLTFFSLRFVLGCLLNGTARNLFACLVDGVIAGLVYLRPVREVSCQGLEIKYIASATDARADRICKFPPHRGVGTFLVAGVWLLWKNFMPRVREIVLDAELQALGFYEGIGFQRKRPYVFALTRPAGVLLNALAVMSDRSPSIRAEVITAMQAIIGSQIKVLRRRKVGDPRRDQALAFVKLCLLARSQPQLAHSAAVWLLKHKARIPEAENLLQWAACHGRIQFVKTPKVQAYPLLLFKDEAMQRHLAGVFHLESSNRTKVLDGIFEDAALAGRWSLIGGRGAVPSELAWVHSHEHIARIAATAGKPLLAIDLDTQTTQDSYAAACLAVGGVFSLLDGICTTSSKRGFASVRPPGHHAEPNRAMGFCLFNNIALGACYLKHVHGVKKVMIVDIDAHHGNGTQAAFDTCDDVLFVSMHQFPCYPGSGNYGEVGHGAGEGFTVNVPLDKGMGDPEFIQVIDHLVEPLACAYEPEIMLISCGFDLYRHDRLAGLQGTPDGYGALTHLLCRVAGLVCGGRIAFILEGGYSVQGIRECGLQVIQELCNLATPGRTLLDKRTNRSPSVFSNLQKTIAVHKKYWSILNR